MVEYFSLFNRASISSLCEAAWTKCMKLMHPIYINAKKTSHSRLHFQMNILEWKDFDFDLCLTDNKQALVMLVTGDSHSLHWWWLITN